MLIEHGADVAAQTTNGKTPLHLASRNARAKVIRLLIEHGADVEAQTTNEETPLHLASRNGRIEVTRLLIEHGADVTAQNKDGDTPLHHASVSVSDPHLAPKLAEVSRILLEQGANANAQNKCGLTPFRPASQSTLGGDRRAQVLLQHGADPSDGKIEDFSLCISNSDSDSEMYLNFDQYS
jgi:ankyrin repeat protein